MNPSDELSNENQQPVSPAPLKPGARLVLARSQRGLTSEQVARETNLSPRYVHALESDDYDALPGAAFIRGYLRRYAQLVQLPADELVASFDDIWRTRAPADAVSSPSAIGRPLPPATSLGQASRDLLNKAPGHFSVARVLSWGSLALLLLLIVGTLFWNGDEGATDVIGNDSMTIDIEPDISNLPQPEQAEPLPAPVEQLTPAEPAVEEVAPASQLATPIPGMPGMPGAAAPTSAPATTPAVTPAAPGAAPAPATLAPAPKPAASASAVPAAPVAPRVAVAAPGTVAPAVAAPAAAQPAVATAPRIETLSFNFSGKSWISVRDATGQELVYGLKNPGQAVTVTGQAPFSINIGNVNATTMSRNGKTVNLKPYTRGEIASFRLAR